MNNVLLITAADIKSQSNVEQNANEKILTKLILNVQETQLRPILQDSLYNTVLIAVTDKANNSVDFPDPVAAILPLITSFLINAVMVDFIVMNNYKMTNKGTLKLNDNSGSSVASNEVEYIKNYYDNYKATYKAALIDYLIDNKLTLRNSDVDITSEASGWLLDTPINQCGDVYYNPTNGNCYDMNSGSTSGSSNGGGFLITEVDPVWEADKPGIQSQIDLKAPLDSPTLTGIPNAPTADLGTDTTQIASTAFVNAEINAAIFGDISTETDPTVPVYAKTLVDIGTIITDLETIDGDGSGLDADLLDGQEGSYYNDYNNLTNVPDIPIVFQTIHNQTALQLDADFSIDGSGGLWSLQNGFTFNSSEIAYAFSQGCFIQTEIPATTVLSFELYISGNTGGSLNPLFTVVNGSTGGSSTFVNLCGIALGSDVTIHCFFYNSHLCFWISSGVATAIHFKLVAKGSGNTQYKFALTDAILPISGISGNVNLKPYQAWNENNDGDGSGLDADLLDGQHGDYYLDFNNLTNTPTGFTGAFADLTGKPTTIAGYGITDAFTPAIANTLYSLLGHTHTFASLTAVPTTLAGYGITDTFFTQAVADTLYKAIGYVPSWASITSKPTTIAGYAITDFNSLGDARWSLLAHTHTFASLTSKPTTLSGYAITDAYPLSGNPSGFLTSIAAQSFASLTGKPTTIAGYGITDAFTQTLADARYSLLGHTHTFASLTATPTTLSGYGITDAYPLTGNPSGFLTSIAAQSFASLTGKPTTISGYGITDFNATGDIRYSQLGHVHTFASLTSIPTTVAGYGITDVYTKTLGDARYLQSYTETDPIFIASVAHAIVAGDITNWNSKIGASTTLAGYGITDAYTKTASDARYLQSFTETDPIFVASAAHGITSGNITSWTAKQAAITTGTTSQYFRGDLSLATFPTETDPVFIASAAFGITSGNITTWNAKESALTFSTGLARSTNTITATLSTGLATGQSVIGGTGSGENLTLASTTHATKGQIRFGGSTFLFNEATGMMGLGISVPTSTLHVSGQANTLNINASVGTVPTATTTIPTGINVNGNFTDATSALRGFSMIVTANGSVIGQSIQALGFTANQSMTAASIGTMEGVSGTLSLTNAGTVGNVYGFRSILLVSNTGSVTTAMINFDARSPSCTSTGTVANSYGLNIAAQTVTGVTVGWGINQIGTSDKNFFGGKIGIGQTSPTALLHIKGGTATANTAPLKLTSGTVLGTTEAGAIEYDGSHLYFTAANAGTRYQLDQQSGSVAWGGITGTLSSQTDLNTALNLLAPIASPTFTGTVTAPAFSSTSYSYFGNLRINGGDTSNTIYQATGNLALSVTAGNSIIFNGTVLGMPTYSRVTGSNFTVTADGTSTTLRNITGLTYAAAINSTYEFEAVLSVSSTSGGLKYGVNYSAAGAAVEGAIYGTSSASTLTTSRISALNTGYGLYSTSTSVGNILLKGVFTTGSNTGNFTIITATNTTFIDSTTYINSYLKVTKIA